MKITVKKEGELLDYLYNNIDMPKKRIKQYLTHGAIFVNNTKTTKYNYRILPGMTIMIDTDSKNKKTLPFDILFEDDHIIVVNKPSGLLTIATAKEKEKTLYHIVREYLVSKDKNARVFIVHRLDKDTSGLMLVAKNEFTHEKLSEMIGKKDVERKYLAIVDGLIKHDTGTIDAPIGRDPNNRQKMAVTDINGKDSITHFKVLERFDNNTFIECILETGRTHQIRVHMNYIGFPINNDPLYGRGKSTEFGQMLHSYSIKFNHPRTGKELSFRVDPPKEFMDKLNELRQN